MPNTSAESARIQQIVDDVLERRASGQRISDAEVLASHPDLSAALKVELRLLGLMEAAASRAKSRSSSSAGATGKGASGSGTDTPTVAAGSGTRLANARPPNVPGYAIEGEIHRGGQGVVFRATQIATGRTVAIKALRDHTLASSADLARFDREVRILAKLRHPGIVTIHDSGVADGVFYFVMDYVEGETLTAHANTAKLSIRDRLLMFAQVCEAVHAAHLMGVIHRDLKPGNILVGRDNQPRVLDFGLAKAEDDFDSSTTAMTQTGQFLGSLPWAAPEQVEGHTDLIDVRTDVYALGVVLFQLLTGRFPYDVNGSMRAVVQNILNTEPALSDTSFNEELRTILRKTLSKERERRYQSARELAMDVRAYLAGEPLLARRDSFGYLLRKQLRRNWLPVSVGLAFVLLLIVGFGVSLSLWRRAETQRIRAEEQTELATKEADRANAEAENAQRETKRAMLIIDYLRTIMRSTNPGDPQSAELTMRDMLARAHQGLQPPAFAEHEGVRKELLATIGATYLSFGLYEEAAEVCQEAIEAAKPMGRVEVAYQQNNYANVLDNMGRYSEAAALYKESLDALIASGVGEATIARTENNYANALANLGRIDEAVAHYRLALAAHRRKATGADDYDLATTMSSLGCQLGSVGECEEAEQLLREALEMHTRLLGEDHSRVGVDLNNLATLYSKVGRYEESLQLVEKSYRIRCDAVGKDHPDIVVMLNNLAASNFRCGHLRRAEELVRECIDLQRRTTPDHPELCNAMLNLAVFVATRGDHQQAMSLANEAHDLILRTVGPDHPLAARVQFALGTSNYALGRWEEAESAFTEVLPELIDNREVFATVAAATYIASMRLQRDDPAGAEEVMRRANEVAMTQTHPDFRAATSDLVSAALAARQGYRDEAREMALGALPEIGEAPYFFDIVSTTVRIAADVFERADMPDIALACRETAACLDDKRDALADDVNSHSMSTAP
ncbi:MAG: serine/threonine protein kinase [Phycisphaerales bacterium]|nr:serine/threonine protein kinase [Phycisphaerales bacterium]